MQTLSRSTMLRWMVVMTFWLGAVVPAFGMAWAAQQGELAPWTQLCRSSLVSPRAEVTSFSQGGQDDQASHAMFKHCAWCALHQQDLAAPPPLAVPAFQPLPGLRFGLPERFFSAELTAHAWRPAAARAPPASI
ncbi:DUF2946 domain-containing protein [Pelomonas sp. SE-A7]|uniref:DUF2946 domain-containing protein n=1 Tax=Pelomonas sp. SE-A7 TaxID=3054953 RepID=UPI00259D1EE2|nr:DUF2946 domain-containing protein [Pelomonas sp. SE-A7]MDM4766210.1 DUF2946 domain-containing protein [Pelomonas sp. SE-A7]